MKKCAKCNKIYDDSWNVCLHCDHALATASLEEVERIMRAAGSDSRESIINLWYKSPLVWLVRIVSGIAIASFFCWYYFEVFLTNVPQTLSFGRRLIAMMDIVHPGELGEAFMPFFVFLISAGITFGIFLMFKKITKMVLIITAFIMGTLVVTPYLLPNIGVSAFGRNESKIDLIFFDTTDYKTYTDTFNANSEKYYRFRSFMLPKNVEADVANDDAGLEKAYAELRKQARRRGADAIIMMKDGISQESAYMVTPRNGGKSYTSRITYSGPNPEKNLSMNDKYDYKFISSRKYISGEMVLYKDTTAAVPRLIKALKSWFTYKRREAITALGLIKDERAIGPLMDIVKKGRNNPNYLDAIDALSRMKYEGIYPTILDIAKNGSKDDKRHIFVTSLYYYDNHCKDILPLYAEWYQPATGKDFIGLLNGNARDVIRAMEEINKPECIIVLKKIVENEKYDDSERKDAEKLITKLESQQ